MNLNGTFVFAGPRTVVWDLLQDPVVLAKALPGTERLARTDDDRFEGALKDKVPPQRFAMQIDGKGGVGFTRGTANVELAEQPDGGTLMTYTSDVQVGGKIASVGQRLMESVGKMMMRQALEALARALHARLDGSSQIP
jgi:carbon monoxide dehydrogenase subunit G